MCEKCDLRDEIAKILEEKTDDPGTAVEVLTDTISLIAARYQVPLNELQRCLRKDLKEGYDHYISEFKELAQLGGQVH